ncbi:MAG TPA: hypothetical protein VL308_01445 [Gemmatimonadaceae bacterium]|jgi:hypothetical protein|nr:hypothetical protein [Gemmatimonadaceae bacterium]
MVSSIRWFLLIGAVLSFLQATLLFGVTQRMIEPWYRLSERAGGRIPRYMRDRRLQRGWLLFNSIVFGTCYWLSGTAAGSAWLQNSLHEVALHSQR